MAAPSSMLASGTGGVGEKPAVAQLSPDGFVPMANGSLQLREYPGEIVHLSCEKCGRAGQYRKQNLIERYGPDMRLPDLRQEIAKCERRGQMLDMCMVHYIDLVPR